MSDNNNKHYLTVNSEEYFVAGTSPLDRHKLKIRCASPGLVADGSMVSFDEAQLQKAASSGQLRSISEMSLYNDDAIPTTSSESSPSLAGKKRHKSIENLCFGVRNRKKLHRKAQVTEIPRSRCYTDTAIKQGKNMRHLHVPILRIPEGEISSEMTPSSTPPQSPSPTPSLVSYERTRNGNSGVFGSLLKQTLKVTSASMGFRAASVERLAPYTFRPLSEDVKQRFSRSTSSVSTLAQLPPDSLTSMAPLQTHTEAHSVQCLDSIVDWDSSNTTHTTTTTTTKSSSSPPQQPKTSKRNALQHQSSIAESIESTSIGCATSSDYSSARSLKHSSTSLAPLQSIPSSTSLRSISPSRASSSNSSSTAKHEQSSAAATAAGAAAAAGATTSSGSTANTTPPEKEKKRKEVSSSREKKFRRYFSQVSKDEKLINYFSCALVGDILLQGHLYITDQHFAFYSNVFGYVTKVVIPTSSVTKISKEKTAKIIPNAVGVATADERHVFGSFISREAAFRLMVSVCSPLAPAEILPKDPASTEIPEVYSIEDDSSCSISGNESPAQVTENGNSSNENHHSDPSQTILRRSVGTSNLSIAESALDHQRHSDIPLNAKTATSAASLHLRASAPPAAASSHFGNGTTISGIAEGGGGIAHMISKISSSPATAIGCATIEGNLTFIAAGSASTTTSATTTPTPSTSSSPTTVMALPHTKVYQVMTKFRTLCKKLMVNVKFPTEIHVVYLGVMLSILLAVFTIFLLYRILDIEAKTNVYRSPVEFNWQSGNDEDIFAEALRFQKQLQLKSTEEAQNILKTNLEQIAKVRRSLETLSMLIHDRSSSFGATTTDDSD